MCVDPVVLVGNTPLCNRGPSSHCFGGVCLLNFFQSLPLLSNSGLKFAEPDICSNGVAFLLLKSQLFHSPRFSPHSTARCSPSPSLASELETSDASSLHPFFLFLCIFFFLACFPCNSLHSSRACSNCWMSKSICSSLCHLIDWCPSSSVCPVGSLGSCCFFLAALRSLAVLLVSTIFFLNVLRQSSVPSQTLWCHTCDTSALSRHRFRHVLHISILGYHQRVGALSRKSWYARRSHCARLFSRRSSPPL